MNGEENQTGKPFIEVKINMPYKVRGVENFTNSMSEKIKTSPVMHLCRCGESLLKPCCDGRHNIKGIDGEKKPGRVKDKLHSFKGKEITIHDNRGVCSHDGACLMELPTVFIKGRRPWIDPDGATPQEVMDTIHKCPSGALSYTYRGKTYEGLDRPPAIKVAQDGPYEITGGISLQDDQGCKPQMPEHYTLCRCGGSKNQPFCDGTHGQIGFFDEKN